MSHRLCGIHIVYNSVCLDEKFLIGNECLLKVFMLHKSLFNLNEGQVALFKGTQLKIFSF